MSPAGRARPARRGKPPSGPILFYDRDCRACTLAARMLIAADTGRRLRSAAIDSAEGHRHLGELSHEVRYGAFHLLRAGRVLTGPEAIGPLLELLPPLRPGGRLLRRSPAARKAAAWLYETLSRYRGQIGRLLPPVRPPSR